MTANLIEFMKVFVMVFGFSATILAGRHFMINFDKKREEKETNNVLDIPEIQNINPDLIDYDGMGNQGRFPMSNKSKKK